MKKTLLLLTLFSYNLIAADFPANPELKEQYNLIFNDNFDTVTLDNSKWDEYYFPHWASPKTINEAKATYKINNGELKLYIEPTRGNWSPFDSTVKISSLQTFNKPGLHRFNSNAVVQSHSDIKTSYEKFVFQYGYAEIRAKFNNTGGGGHQAWWLVGTERDDTNLDGRYTKENGEIDIIETFFNHGNVWQSVVHPHNDPNMTYYYNGKYKLPKDVDVANEFHIYAMDWTPNGLKFYFDNKLVFEVGPQSVPHYPMAMLLGIYTDAGSGQHNNIWPKEWSIDYVRVWQHNEGYNNPVVTFKNRWTGDYLRGDNNTDTVTYSNNADVFSQWEKVPVPGTNYFQIKNQETGKEMYVEDMTGNVQYADVPNSYWSSHWIEVEQNGYKQLLNRNINAEINIENQTGIAELSNVPNSYWSSHWKVSPIFQ